MKHEMMPIRKSEIRDEEASVRLSFVFREEEEEQKPEKPVEEVKNIKLMS